MRPRPVRRRRDSITTRLHKYVLYYEADRARD